MSRTYTLSPTGYNSAEFMYESGGTEPNNDFSNYTVLNQTFTRFGVWGYLNQYPQKTNYAPISFLFDASTLAHIAAQSIESITLSYNVDYKDTNTSILTIIGSLVNRTTLEIDSSTTFWTQNALRTYTHDLTSLGAPLHGYAIGAAFDGVTGTRNFGIATISLVIVTDEEQRTLSYNANGGSGAPSAQTVWGDSFSSSTTVSSTVPTRTGYSFTGWNTAANGTGTSYSAGNSITLYDSTTVLYAQWSALKSTITSASNGQTGGKMLVKWNALGNFSHQLTFQLGNAAVAGIQVTAGVSQYEFSIPRTWNAQLPSTTSGTARVTLSTIADGTNIGTDSATFTVTVPATVVPTIGTLTAAKVNNNATVAGWDIYLQSFSQVKLTASSLAAGDGATLSSIRFVGANMDVTNYVSGTSANATSNVITVYGNQTYTVTLTDSRGRTATKTVTISVTAYQQPTVQSLSPLRCDSDGTVNPTTGTSLKATPVFTFAQVGNNAVTNTLSYKASSSSSYTQVATNVASGVTQIFAVGLALVDSAYNVQIVLTDSLGSSVTYTVTVPSVVGISFGLKNDRARFGGVVQQAGLQIDWDTEIDGVLNVLHRQSRRTLSDGTGWYRIITYKAGSAAQARGSTPFKIDISIEASSSAGADAHSVSLIATNGTISFTNEISQTWAKIVDGIRFTYNGVHSYVDVHLTTSVAVSIQADYNISAWQLYKSRFTHNNFTLVSDAPSGETIEKTYTFAQNGMVVESLAFTNVNASGYGSFGGNVSVGGNLTVTGNETVTGQSTVNNQTISGTLDVTNRRCYATLSSAGWYRVLTNQASELAVQAFEIELTINRTNYFTNNETHKILLQAVYNNIKFVDEKSLSNVLGIDKIRYTYKSGYGYVDIHYALSTSNYVAVDFDVKIRPDRQYQVYANSLEAVADAPSGETVLTTYEFAGNTETQSALITSANITSLNGTIWGSESYIKFVWDAEKVVISGYVLLQNPASGTFRVSFPTPSGFPASKFANNWSIVGQAYRRSGGYMMPCDFCYANVASSAISITERNMFASHPATDYAMITIPTAIYHF